MPVEVKVLIVGVRLHQYRVAVCPVVYPLLYSVVIPGDVDDGGTGGQRKQYDRCYKDSDQSPHGNLLYVKAVR